MSSLCAALLFLLLFLPSVAQAQADESLAAVQARIEQPTLLRGQFSQQKTVVGFKKPLISSGDFLLWRDHGVLWHTLKPFDSLLVLRRASLSITQGDGRASYQTNAGHQPGLQAVNALLFALFSGDVAMLQREFAISAAPPNEGSSWRLLLTPTSSALQQVFHHIELSGDRYLQTVRLDEKSGDSTLIRFSGQQTAPPPTPDEAARLAD